MKIANRADRIEPFYVMEVAKAAQALAAKVAGTADPMIFLNIGEPDFTAPPLVQKAASQAIESGLTQYTPALGIAPLREALSAWYAQRFGVDVPARRIVITAGASAALQLVCLVAYDTPRGNLAAYYPETNPLVPLTAVAERAGTPTSKSIPVVLERAATAHDVAA